MFSTYSVCLSVVLVTSVLANPTREWLPCWERACHLALHVCCKKYVALFRIFFPRWCLGGDFDFN